MWLDAQRFDQVLAADVGDGSITSAAMSQSGRRAATAAVDGTVRVWDVDLGTQVAEIPLDRAVVGVAFLDDAHLAVSPGEGGVLLETTDADELLAIVQGSLTRGFTAAECSRFGFGTDCPTLAELGGPFPGAEDSAAVDGVYRWSWTTDALVTASEDWYRNTLGTEVLPGAVGDFEDLASDLVGAYTLTLDGGRYDLVNDRHPDAPAAGTYLIRDGRLWLRSERGTLGYADQALRRRVRGPRRNDAARPVDVPRRVPATAGLRRRAARTCDDLTVQQAVRRAGR